MALGASANPNPQLYHNMDHLGAAPAMVHPTPNPTPFAMPHLGEQSYATAKASLPRLRTVIRRRSIWKCSSHPPE